MINISSKDARFRLGAVRGLAAIVLTVVACLAIPALAGAQTIDPTDSQYGNTVQQVSSGGSACADNNSGTGSAAGSASCAPPPEAGGLPFTGLDVAALGAVAAFLLLAGLGLRRARFGERNPA